MNQLLLQLRVVALSLLGIIALVPGPNREGKLRIQGPLNNIITRAGITFLLGPWLAIPFIAQPRFIGFHRAVMVAVGIILCASGSVLYALSLKALLPAFAQQFTEFTPEALVEHGPYRYVRHPIYLSAFVILLGLYLAMGATLSIVLLPICYLLLRLVTVYEEKWILEPKFSTKYLEYKARVNVAIMGCQGGLAFAAAYLVLAGMSLLDLMGRINVHFIE